MSDDSGNSHVSHYLDEDQYEVVFLFGPLDGGRMVTDEQPNTRRFVHRLANRQHVYEYQLIEPNQFLATYRGVAGFEDCPQASQAHEGGMSVLVFTLLGVVSVSLLVVLFGLLAGGV